VKNDSEALKLKDMISSVVLNCNPAANIVVAPAAQPSQPQMAPQPSNENKTSSTPIRNLPADPDTMAIVSINGASPKGSKFTSCLGMGDAARMFFRIASSYSPEYFVDVREIYCAYAQTPITMMGKTIISNTIKIVASKVALDSCLSQDVCGGSYVNFQATPEFNCYLVFSVTGGRNVKNGWFDPKSGPVITPGSKPARCEE
jgi:hypothetical protein